jgi:hypothetical protein
MFWKMLKPLQKHSVINVTDSVIRTVDLAGKPCYVIPESFVAFELTVGRMLRILTPAAVQQKVTD